MVTKTEIVELLRNNDKAVARALVALNKRQTSTEQHAEATINRNGEGFRPCHARMGTSMAEFYSKRGYLSPKQVAYWRTPMKGGKMRIEIYAGQLLDIAMAKAAQQVEQPKEDLGNLNEEMMVLLEMLTNAEVDYRDCKEMDDEETLAKCAERVDNIKARIDALCKRIEIASR